MILGQFLSSLPLLFSFIGHFHNHAQLPRLNKFWLTACTAPYASRKTKLEVFVVRPAVCTERQKTILATAHDCEGLWTIFPIMRSYVAERNKFWRATGQSNLADRMEDCFIDQSAVVWVWKPKFESFCYRSLVRMRRRIAVVWQSLIVQWPTKIATFSYCACLWNWLLLVKESLDTAGVKCDEIEVKEIFAVVK